MKVHTNPDFFSYYNAPVTNISPLKGYTLYDAHYEISIGVFQMLTNAVRADPLKKKKILPYITASGLFKQRKFSGIISYSSVVSIDLDHMDTRIKTKIFSDPFLNPGLIFVSPSGNGLKIFIRVTDGVASQHNDYFNAISTYLFSNYGVPADLACRDIPRPCFLCHDPYALFSESGSVSASDLLKISPPVETHGGASPSLIGASHSHSGSSPLHGGASSEGLAPHSSCYDPYKVKIINKPLDDCKVKNVRSNPAIHALAEKTLINHGWYQNGEHWTRPGKEVKAGKSAIFNSPNADGVCIFTVFSSNAHPFQVRGYNDFQIIALLDYAGDVKTCFKELIAKYPT